MSTIADDWRAYERDVIPGCAGSVERAVTRRAFHAGAHAVLSRLNRMAESDMTDREGTEALARLIDECEAFRRAVAAGRA